MNDGDEINNMKNLKYMGLLLLTIFSLTACGKNESDVVLPVESTDVYADEANYIDITDKVNERKVEYANLLDFGKKHGLLYIDGKQTNGVPVMEVITPLKEGDKIVERKKVVYSPAVPDFVYFETDFDSIYDTIKDFNRDEIYKYLYDVNITVPYEMDEVDWKEYIDVALCTIGYDATGAGLLSEEEYASLSDNDLKIHVAKVLSYYNEVLNNETKEYENASKENTSEEIISYTDDFENMDEDYQNWYIDNLELIGNVRTIDFTTEGLPKEVIMHNDRYYIDKKEVKYEENGTIILNIYGKDIYF